MGCCNIGILGRIREIVQYARRVLVRRYIVGPSRRLLLTMQRDPYVRFGWLREWHVLAVCDLGIVEEGHESVQAWQFALDTQKGMELLVLLLSITFVLLCTRLYEHDPVR